MLPFLEEDMRVILDHTRESWLKLKDQTVFITGGTGFFGIWFILSFIFINRELALNARLIILSRNVDAFFKTHPWLRRHSDISMVKGDVATFDFFEGEIHYIIHAATEASVKVNIENPIGMFDTAVLGTRRVLEFARVKNVKSFLLISSGAVYGQQPYYLKKVSENFTGAPNPSGPTSMYGEAKRISETLGSAFARQHNIPVKIARCFAFIGPFLPLDSHFAVGNFIKSLIEKKDIVIEGDGTPIRSYMYASDLMIWLWTILFNGETNLPYNVGSDEPLSILELAELIARQTHKGPMVNVKGERNSSPPQRYVPNINRGKNLGLALYTPLDVAIAKTVTFNRANYCSR